MALFTYEAVEADGRVVRGNLRAADRSQAVAALHQKGAFPLHLAPAAGSQPAGRRLAARQLAGIVRELSVMLEAGLELDKALTILARMESVRVHAPVLRDLLADIRAGAPLSEALERAGGLFPPHAVGMVRAGEAAGALSEVLAELAALSERQAEAQEQLRSALIYPTILLVTTGLAVTVLFTIVLPQLEVLFDAGDERLPLVTRLVLSLGELFRNWGIPAAAAGLGAGLTLAWLSRQPRFRRPIDRWMLRLPGLGGMVRQIEAGRCLRMLSVLLGNGVPAARGVELAGAAVANRVIAEGIGQVHVAMVEGRGIAGPLAASRLFPPAAVDLVRVGEETGRLAPMLAQAAKVLEVATAQRIQRILAILVPLLTIGLGGLIALVIAAVVMAILSVNSLAV